MDKQKQIEEKKEIAKELDKVYPNAKFTNGWIAEVLYKLGYRKIPEGAVVLTREEYDRLTNSEIGELVKENEELGKSNVEWSELYRRLKIKYQQVRKETAEKIADWLDNEKGYCGLGYLVKQNFCAEEKGND